MDYDKIYKECVNSWKLLDKNKTDIKGITCETQHFFNEEKRKKGENSNLTFFFVDGVIIGLAFEYCENINIFGQDW